MDCPVCEKELDGTMVTVDLGGGWATITIECNHCGAMMSADIESDNFEVD